MAVIANRIDQERLRYSGRILASCLLHLEGMLRPNVDAGTLNQFAIDFIRSYEAEPCFLGYLGFPHALCTSVNEEVVHGLSDPTKIFQEGDVVSLDLGVNYQGLFTDAARTFIIRRDGVDQQTYSQHIADLNLLLESRFDNKTGKPSFFGATGSTATLLDKQQLLLVTNEGLRRGIAAVKAGGRVGDIGEAVNGWVQPFGYGNVTALGGHGVGRSVHEEPYIPHIGKKGQGKLLVEHMVIAIEPMLTMSDGHNVKFDSQNKYGWDVVKTGDNSLSCHFENTLIVTKKGAEVVTTVTAETLLPVKAS